MTLSIRRQRNTRTPAHASLLGEGVYSSGFGLSYNQSARAFHHPPTCASPSVTIKKKTKARNDFGFLSASAT
jgi:hypothetical protein